MFVLVFFFFNDTATTEIYTLSLHDALPILPADRAGGGTRRSVVSGWGVTRESERSGSSSSPKNFTPSASTALDGWSSRISDRKSTRLNSSHANISYAVFCLKKKNKTDILLL